MAGPIGRWFFAGKDEYMPRDGLRIKNDYVEEIEGGNFALGIGMLAMAFGATLFGGIHIGAWNFKFPSRIELIFWRCASVFSAAFGPPLIFLIILSVFLRDRGLINIVILAPIWSFLYVMARLFLLVEIFRTLCFLPPDAYISTWTTNIPHVI